MPVPEQCLSLHASAAMLLPMKGSSAVLIATECNLIRCELRYAVGALPLHTILLRTSSSGPEMT